MAVPLPLSAHPDTMIEVTPNLQFLFLPSATCGSDNRLQQFYLPCTIIFASTKK